jgi:hypothetical protein
MARVGHDQMAAAMGSRYQSRNSRPYRPRSRKSPSVWSPGMPPTAIAVASRLNRTMSASMPQNRGRRRFRRWPNTVARLAPAHSRSRSRKLTAKDMSLATDSTPRCAKSAQRFG